MDLYNTAFDIPSALQKARDVSHFESDQLWQFKLNLAIGVLLLLKSYQ